MTNRHVHTQKPAKLSRPPPDLPNAVILALLMREHLLVRCKKLVSYNEARLKLETDAMLTQVRQVCFAELLLHRCSARNYTTSDAVPEAAVSVIQSVELQY